MSSLSELVLNHNHIIELPNTIGLLRNLRTFYICENDMTYLPADVNKIVFILNIYFRPISSLFIITSIDWKL